MTKRAIRKRVKLGTADLSRRMLRTAAVRKERQSGGGDEREPGRRDGSEGRDQGERGDNFKNPDDGDNAIRGAQREAPVAGSECLRPAPEAHNLREPYPEKNAGQNELHRPIQICHCLPCLFFSPTDLWGKSLDSGPCRSGLSP